MRKRKVKSKLKIRKHKPHVARTPDEVERYKKKFLVFLAQGKWPKTAARLAGISRAAVFGWKKDDEQFAADWHDAIEGAMDELEKRTFQAGLTDSPSDRQFMLKHRRKDIYGGTDPGQRGGLTINISLQEHILRLQRLGLPVPQIESDQVEDDEEQSIASEGDSGRRLLEDRE
jgi:hypothetical protein